MAPELVTLTIDGQQVKAPKGELLIETCANQGIYVPRFCYHPHLVPYAGCRMCLVDVEKMPKLATACSTPVGEGMVVHTANEKVRQAREGVLEFILVSHPLDCPVCDKGGECDLQDQTFLYGPPDSRMLDVRRFHPNTNLSPTIKLDYNRCILCKRCVRYTEEIGDDDRLIFRDRGAHTEIDTQTGQQFNSRFGGTVIEYCPVGALTDRVFRFRARPWEIKQKPSHCTGCAMGCASELHVRSNEVVRIFNREQADLNGYYICDKGRFGHEYTAHDARVTEPLLRKDGRLQKVSWGEALSWASEQLRRILATDGAGAIAGLIGADRSLEDLFAFRQLMDGLGTGHLDHGPSAALTPHQTPYFLNRLATFDQAVASKNLLLFDMHLFDDLPMLGLRIKQGHDGLVQTAWGPRNPAKVQGISAVRSYHSRYPWVKEALVPRGQQAAFLAAVAKDLAAHGRVAPELKAPLAAALESIPVAEFERLDQALVRAWREALLADDAVLGIGHQILLWEPQLLELLELVVRLREGLTTNKKLPLLLGLPEASSAGALALGIQPSWDTRGPVGRDLEGIIAGARTGDLKGLLMFRVDLAHRLEREELEALNRLQCCIVATWFLDEVAAEADLVLPAPTPYESEGTYLNAEGRMMHVPLPVDVVPSGVRPLHNLCHGLGMLLGIAVGADVAALRAGIAVSCAPLHGITHVGPTEQRWLQPKFNEAPSPDLRMLAAQSPTPAGTVRLLVRRPFWIGGQAMDHMPLVSELVNPWRVRMHPKQGKTLGLAAGDLATLSTAAGHLTAPVELTRGIPEGYVEVEEGHTGGPLRLLGPLRGGVMVSIHRAASTVGVAV